MNPLVQDNVEAIIDLCREYGVVRLEVFGSVCTGEFDPARSDVDFIVEYPPNDDLGPWGARQFELQECLGSLLGREVELFGVSMLSNKWVR
ncbi:MAG: nucleotidyltransferase domain-containing protein, partial [Chloroflexota bacterium]|nr:nucleotidyltransferase domain-containing protein [Chloroflexota bacterium]